MFCVQSKKSSRLAGPFLHYCINVKRNKVITWIVCFAKLRWWWWKWKYPENDDDYWRRWKYPDEDDDENILRLKISWWWLSWIHATSSVLEGQYRPNQIYITFSYQIHTFFIRCLSRKGIKTKIINNQKMLQSPTDLDLFPFLYTVLYCFYPSGMDARSSMQFAMHHSKLSIWRLRAHCPPPRQPLGIAKVVGDLCASRAGLGAAQKFCVRRLPSWRAPFL